MIKNASVKQYDPVDICIIYSGIITYIGQWVPHNSAGLRSPVDMASLSTK